MPTILVNIVYLHVPTITGGPQMINRQQQRVSGHRQTGAGCLQMITRQFLVATGNLQMVAGLVLIANGHLQTGNDFLRMIVGQEIINEVLTKKSPFFCSPLSRRGVRGEALTS